MPYCGLDQELNDGSCSSIDANSYIDWEASYDSGDFTLKACLESTDLTNAQQLLHAYNCPSESQAEITEIPEVVHIEAHHVELGGMLIV